MTVTNTVPPAISGSAQQGQTLTTTNGTWTFSLDYLTYAYQWERCDAGGANCLDIGGAVNQTYAVQAADVGDTIRVRVTATEHSNPVGTNFYVATTGNDSTGDGSIGNPWKTVKKACDTVTSGTINVAAGTYTETGTCLLKNGVNLKGAGGRTSQTIIKGSPSPLLSVQSTSAAHSIIGIALDGQNKTAGAQALVVNNSSNVTINDLYAHDFVGGTFGGCGHFTGVTNCTITNSTFSNGGHNNPTYVSGAVMVGVATGCTFSNLIVHDDLYMALKCAAYNSTAWTNCTFSNSSFTVGAVRLPNGASGSIAFEVHNVISTGITINNNYFNAVLSIPNSNTVAPAGQYHYDIHNNHFEMQDFPEYAIEFDTNSMHVHHNYFERGGNPLGAFSAAKSGSSVHHNIFDHGDYRSTAMIAYLRYGIFGMDFYKNTMLWRPSPTTVRPTFLLNENISNSNPNIHQNIFSSTSAAGDTLGTLASATIANNVFYNITARGSGSVTAGAQPLAASGSFPAAYVPTGSYTTYGAFADGQFAVGIQ